MLTGMPTPGASDEPLTYDAMRQRALLLASTGRYSSWPEIVAALGYHPVLVRRIDDAAFVAMVNVRCRLAQRSA
jgi:hypothetical protein